MVFCKIFIFKCGNYNIFERSCIYFIFFSVCYIKCVIKYIGIVICIYILLERLLIFIVLIIFVKLYLYFKKFK